jgi:hypothetical protein
MALVDKKSLYDLVPNEGSVSQMDSLQGPQFANTMESTLHTNALQGLYDSSVHNLNYGPMTLDIDGNPGPQFANTQESTLHTDALAGIYNSSVHNLNYGPMGGDMNGNPGPQFANPEQYSPSLHEDALAGVYNSSVHNNQYTMTLYDTDGVTPNNRYLNNLPEGLGALIG